LIQNGDENWGFNLVELDIHIYIWEINDSRVVSWIEIDGEMEKLGN
jgi:hypothetical protein